MNFGIGALIDEPIQQSSQSDILLRSLCSGISRGTEIRVARGEVPSSETQRMRCPNQAGDFPFPVKYGYCNVAEVIEGPNDLRGHRVFALHPHQDFYWLPAHAVMPIPPAMPPGRAILAANMETALNGVWDAGALPGDRIIVIGAGTLGLLLTRLLALIPGCDVTVFDQNPARRELVEAMGAVFVETNALPDDADIAFNASGSQHGLATALNTLGPDGLLVEIGWLQTSTTLPLDAAFHSRRLIIKSSQVGQLPPNRRPRWDHRRRLAKALALLAADPLVDQLITHQISFEEMPATMARLVDGWNDALTIQVNY